MDIPTETRALRRLARALTANDAAADDLVQDTWVAALRHPPEEDRPVRPWLTTVLRNRHGSLLRSRSRERVRHEAIVESEPPPSLMQLQITRQLLEEIAELSPGDRDLIVMRYWEGLSTAECAERLRRPASTVRTRLQRALARLRDRLDERAGGRDAWVGAMVPLVALPKSTSAPASTVGLDGKTLTVGGVFAATLLWLGVAMPQGCEIEGETVAPTVGHRESREQTQETPAVGASVGSVTPRTVPDAEQPEFVPPMTGGSGGGVALDAYESPLGDAGGVHPQLGVAMALRGVDAEIARCRTVRGAARARLVTSIRFLPDGSTLFENVAFDDVVNLVPTEIDCIRATIMGRELAVRTVDATMLGLPPGTTVVYEPRADLSISAAGRVELVGVHARPSSDLMTDAGGHELREALASCGQGSVEMELVFEPTTGALRHARSVDAQAGTPSTRCVAQVLEQRVRSLHPFEPEVEEHAKLACSIELGSGDGLASYTCFNLGPEPRDQPRPAPR